LAAQAKPNIRFGPRALSFLLATLAHDELCSNSNSKFHPSLSARVGSPGSDSCLPTLLPSRSGSIDNLLSGYPLLVVSSSQDSNVSLLGVDAQSGISKNPARPTIAVQTHFAARDSGFEQVIGLVPIFGSNFSGYPQRNFSRLELIK